MDDPKVVLAQLPSPSIKHGAKLKEIRAIWDQGCARILQKSHLSREGRIQVVMSWLQKVGVKDYVLGDLIVSFSRPLPIPPSDEQRKTRSQKALVRLVYQDEFPHLRAVNTVINQRLEKVPDTVQEGSLKSVDDMNDRELATPGVMFEEFAKSIEDQLVLQYHKPDDPFSHAAE